MSGTFRLWSPDETAALVDLISAGRSKREIATAVGRSPCAVFNKALAIGLRFRRQEPPQPPRRPNQATWSDADRLSAFASVPQSLAELVVNMAADKDVGLKALRSETRLASIVDVRKAIISEARRQGYSLPTIARALNRDHTTILHHVRFAETHKSGEKSLHRATEYSMLAA